MSYGTVGNQDISWYASRRYYTVQKKYNNLPAMTLDNFANPDLSWETSKKLDIGFDLSLLNRIHWTVDYYNETTSGALYQTPISMTTGLSTMYENLASIRNRGLEISLNTTLMQTKELSWNLYANLTWNQNKVLKLNSDKPQEGTFTVVQEGYPYGEFYMKEYAGIDHETGKPLWYLNQSGDKTTSNYNAAAKRYLGSPNPKVLGGFGTSLTWKDFDFSIDFKYRLGYKVYNASAIYTGFGMYGYSVLEDVALNSWTENNKNAKYPQYISGDPYYASQYSSRFLYSGNFLRINHIILGYTVPARWTQKAFIQKLRVYLSLDNAYTFTAKDFVGYNPETYANGLIAWQYPANRTFIGGIQLTF
ncbi:MAG: hypothetical protein LUC45_07525 [Paraprevotella sp.]|nr:hypothetical protein [Paraprevotella sp.]